MKEVPAASIACTTHSTRADYFLALFKKLKPFKVIREDLFFCFLYRESLSTEDGSEISESSGHEADEGGDRPGAGGSLRGVRTLSNDEQQSRFQEHHEQEVSIDS